jgi:hypothetical protein
VLPPASHPYKGRPVVGPSGHVPPGETHAARLLMPVPPGVWATRAQSRHPVPTRATRCTRAGPQPCATAKLPAVDSNHDRRAQNAASCQLDERASVRAARFERALDRI